MTRPIKRALISVSDKTGLAEFATGLSNQGIEILSTGGTAKTLAAAGIKVVEVSSVTGFPEIMNGRVKTLHPKIHGGLLAVLDNPDHAEALARHDIAPIGLLVVNLYPFEEIISKNPVWDEAIENIDVGGPAMIRAAAKNHQHVTVVVDPADYELVLTEIVAGANRTQEASRKKLAAKAFSRTAAYDAAISQWLNRQLDTPVGNAYFATGGKRVQELRYGENPHQSAALIATSGTPYGITAVRQVQGKELSYNNINDTDAALECLAEFDGGGLPACVIVKHANPCGVAVGQTLEDAYKKALACDPVSAFGGIVALNRNIDARTAQEITSLFTEVIVAITADSEALKVIAGKKKLRLLLLDARPMSGSGLSVRSVGGGLLVQTPDCAVVDSMDLRVVTARAPTERELSDLRFAYRVVKHVKSNAIVYAKDGATVGIGAGQMSRVDSARIAVWKSDEVARIAQVSGSAVRDSVVASDAFFPFADGLLRAAEAGATAVIQPGGSMRDEEVIRAADEAGLAMVFTGVRHFKH